MKTQLAEQLLNTIIDCTEDELHQYLLALEAHATWKWDSYEGFRAGARFLESLARWLQEFEGDARRRWLDFIVNDLIFISSHEMDHAIESAYETALRPLFIRSAAQQLEVEGYLTSRITSSAEFKEVQRRTLILGLSDGARLDQLRRSNTELSHEQFTLTIDLDEARRSDLLSKMVSATADSTQSPQTRRFSHVVLVDDFYGSGTSLIDLGAATPEGPTLKGKIRRFLDKFDPAYSEEEGTQLLEPGYKATILLYVASAAAEAHIRQTLTTAGLGWDVKVMQPIAGRVEDPQLLDDCRSFWDASLEDEHKKNSSLGYRDCALPVVLHHNAPNNSVCPLWADSTGRGGAERHALFPRYERHHVDRP